MFVGNPGTGKTTVARLIGQLYRAIGILSQGQLVEVDRSGLVAGYVGQTALKTQEVLQSALGGVLFLDEAYALAPASPTDYGREAIEVLLKGMEDHRKDLVVIAAGYPDPMEDFLHSNPGLASRFPKTLVFADYTPPQRWPSSRGCAGRTATPCPRRPRRRPPPGSRPCTTAGTPTSATPAPPATPSRTPWPARPTGWPPWRPPAGRT